MLTKINQKAAEKDKQCLHEQLDLLAKTADLFNICATEVQY